MLRSTLPSIAFTAEGLDVNGNVQPDLPQGIADDLFVGVTLGPY